MKLFQKKKNNKGFSLVELIVVVAIMAVLLGVLVPTLVSNIEKSKHKKDIKNIAEVLNAMQIEMACEEFAGLEGTLIYNGASLEVTTPTDGTLKDVDDPDVSKYLSSVVKNLDGSEATSFELEYTSKMADDDTSVVFTFANEKVTCKVTSTKYGEEPIE